MYFEFCSCSFTLTSDRACPVLVMPILHMIDMQSREMCLLIKAPSLLQCGLGAIRENYIT